ncbi:hypothetical protein PSPO01_08495 [Paraphaeosphaeria sporulosa]
MCLGSNRSVGVGTQSPVQTVIRSASGRWRLGTPAVYKAATQSGVEGCGTRRAIGGRKTRAASRRSYQECERRSEEGDEQVYEWGRALQAAVKGRLGDKDGSATETRAHRVAAGAASRRRSRPISWPLLPAALNNHCGTTTGGQARMRRRAQGTPSRTDAFTLSLPSTQRYTKALATQFTATQRNAPHALPASLSPDHWPASSLHPLSSPLHGGWTRDTALVMSVPGLTAAASAPALTWLLALVECCDGRKRTLAGL